MMKKTFLAFQQFLAKKTSFLTSRQRVNIGKNMAKHDSKKILGAANYIVITFISGLIVIAFSPFSVAETNCPDSPQTVEVIKRDATFRTDSKYSTKNVIENRPKMEQDNNKFFIKFGNETFPSSLKVANKKGIKDDKDDKDKTKGYYCFYQVEVGPQGKTSKWWIESVNLKDYSSWKSSNIVETNTKSDPINVVTKKSDNNLDQVLARINKMEEQNKKREENDEARYYSSLFWLRVIGVGILIIIVIFLLPYLEKLWLYFRHTHLLNSSKRDNTNEGNGSLSQVSSPILDGKENLPSTDKTNQLQSDSTSEQLIQDNKLPNQGKLWSYLRNTPILRLLKKDNETECSSSLSQVSSPILDGKENPLSTAKTNQFQSDADQDSTFEQSMQDNNSQTDYLAAIFNQIHVGHTTISKEFASVSQELASFSQELASVKQEINSLSAKIEITGKDDGTKNAEVEELSQQVFDLQSSLTYIKQKVENADSTIEKSSQQASDLRASLTSDRSTIKALPTTKSPSQPFLASTEPTQNLTVEEVIRQFNSDNREYFRHDYFQPLDLTSDSREGKLQMNGVRIMQLEVSENIHRGSYLKVEIKGEYWLILNIISQGYNRVKKDITNNPEVFKIISSSGTFELIKPAKLRKVNSTLWEIEEAGELRL